MPRLTLQTTPEFEEDLKRIMEQKTLKTKSEAVRFAVHETAARLKAKSFNYSKLLGLGNVGPTNPNPRFKSDDDLWKKE